MPRPIVPSPINELNERSREIFRMIVDGYVATGEPIGSRTLSRLLGQNLSPATIRNVMADLEEAGLLYAPHTSAGRLPTEAGLRLFVDGLLEVGGLAEDERRSIESLCAARGKSLPQALEEATSALSGPVALRRAGRRSRNRTGRSSIIEFVPLGPGRALVVLVTEDGLVENRVIEVPLGMPPSALISRQQLSQCPARRPHRRGGAGRDRQREIASHQAQLDELTSKLVEAGLATWAGRRGQRADRARPGQSARRRDRARRPRAAAHAVRHAGDARDDAAAARRQQARARGCRSLSAPQSHLFGVAGCSMIIAPYQNSREQIVGAIGVIGPTRINYARIIPMVDYTAKVIGRLIG